jgi:hypothetical protein
LAVPIVVVALGALGLVVLHSSLFTIRQIHVSGATPALDSTAEQSLLSFKGASTVTTSQRSVRRQLSSLGVVRVTSVQISSFGVVDVHLALRKAVAVVQGPQGSWLSVDSSGIVLAQGTVEPKLPVICQLTQPSLSLLAVPSTLGCAPFAIAPHLGAQYSSVVTKALEVIPQLSTNVEGRFPTVGVTGPQGDLVLLDNHGDGCLLGGPGAAAMKTLLCEQLIPASDLGQRFLADVSVPTVPAVSSLP